MGSKRKSKRAQKLFCLLPSLHDDVSALLEEDDLSFSFHAEDSPAGCIKQWDTNVIGWFVCRSDKCKDRKDNSWKSRSIATTIRLYPGAKYNARVYKQRCKHCKALGHPDLKKERLSEDSSYADRVAYRIKKWCGVDVERPTFPTQEPEYKGPHRVKLCEGCQAGHCSKT